MARVAVFGLGYVGCVTATCLSRDGHTVIGVDVDPLKVDEVNKGRAPITEPGLAELLARQVRARRLSATLSVAEAVRSTDLALICVGTPSAKDGRVSSAAVERVVSDVGSALRDHDDPYTVVVRSTLLPGLLEDRLAGLLERSSERILGQGVWLCNNPEFLREASALRDYDEPPFVVVGARDEASAQPVLDLYERITAQRIVTDTRSAALVKYACNAYHAVKIAFANEVAVLAQSFGGDGRVVMDLLCRDRKLNVSQAYLRPGFAFGGSCLPKDLRALTRHGEQKGLGLELLNSVLPSNEAQIRRGLKLILRAGKRKVGLVGLSFKAETDDLRESPLVVLAEALLGRGFDLRIYDPHVQLSRLRGGNRTYIDHRLPHLAALLVETPKDLLEGTELLVLGNDVANDLPTHLFGGMVLDLRRDLAVDRRVSEADEAAELSLTERWL